MSFSAAKFRSIFKEFPYFNYIQSKAFDDVSILFNYLPVYLFLLDCVLSKDKDQITFIFMSLVLSVIGTL